MGACAVLGFVVHGDTPLRDGGSGSDWIERGNLSLLGGRKESLSVLEARMLVASRRLVLESQRPRGVQYLLGWWEES